MVGILNSKSDYLMNLDPDDELGGRNILKDLYNLAIQLKVDFVTFFIIYLPNKVKSRKFAQFNKIIKQPKLFESAFSQYDQLIDYYITNKLIKRNLLENSIKLFGNLFFEEKWNYFEDNIWSLSVYKYANSSVFVNKNAYLYYSHNSDSEMNNRGNILELKNLLVRNKVFQYILSKKNEEKYLIASYHHLLAIFEKNINIIKCNNEIKYLCFNHLYNYIKRYNLTDDIIFRINNLINNLTFMLL
jgi:hypothetical protein